MEPTVPSLHPVELLRSTYLTRRKNNPQYSLTAFARDLDLSVSFLSRLLRGERSLTVNQVVQLGALLGLSADQIEQSIDSLVESSSEKSKISKKYIAALKKKSELKTARVSRSVTYFEVERFKAMSEWYHLAILNLTLTKGFNPKPAAIAKRLGINTVEASDAIQRLLQLGLLEKTEGSFKKSKPAIFIQAHKSERAIREFTKQTMKRAEQALEDDSDSAYANRCMPGTTLPIDLKKLPLIKERIRQFQMELIDLAQSDSYDEVYQMNLHLFPLTQTKNPIKNKPGDSR